MIDAPVSKAARQDAKPPNPYGLYILAGATFLICASGVAVVGLAPWSNRSTTVLWAMACTAAGTVLGFLFGVPRQAGSGNAGSAVAHPNLDRLSEWITGVVVGIGLVQAKEIPSFVWRIADKLARGIASDPASLASAQAFGCALIVFFFVMGMIGSYLATRLLLAGLHTAPRATG